ncbi:MAG: hypothetical protein QJT81_21750 [Candidatus Thiothrix putei]|uniref:Tetratricopeptide repeat protein n=1 Tax=Candidatus Thiothrix putei TaxID=3080811 RepID=A0AA95KPI8_9GAMM|nr:MAG: hypothetical protein QJT81_21750 [Candidatus Thiothrix putei]
MKNFSAQLLQAAKANPAILLEMVNGSAVIASLRQRGIKPLKDFDYTDETIRADNMDQLSAEEYDTHDRIYALINTPSSSTDKLEHALATLYALRDKYPDVPSLYNFTAVTLARLGRKEETHAALLETHQRFPDYLFGKISLAEHYLRQGQPEKVPDILNHQFDLTQHFPPDVDLFHISEAIGFYSIVGMYHAATGDAAQALVCYSIVRNLNPDHAGAQALARYILVTDLDPAIKHQNHLADFVGNDETPSPGLLVDDAEEATNLTAAMQAYLPIVMTPTKNLVHYHNPNMKKIKPNEKLKVTEVSYVGDEGGIACHIQRAKVEELLVVSLTHLMPDKKHPLYKAIRHYQLRRIKSLANQQTHRTGGRGE